MILRQQLAELLHFQSCGDLRDCAKPFKKLPLSKQQEYLVRADEIIELIISTIKSDVMSLGIKPILIKNENSQ